LLDPSKPVGTVNAPVVPVPGTQYASGLGFTVATGVTPLPAVSNVLGNFDNEFAWGAAILGHSENDLTRPVVFKPTVSVPDAPSNLTDPLGNGTLTWTDPTPAGQLASPPNVVPVLVATLANPKNEIGFKVLQATIDPATGNLGAFTQVVSTAGVPATVPANVTRWTNPVISSGFAYAVVAFNAAGDSPQSNSFAEQMPIAPTTFTATPVVFNSVTLNFSGGSSTNQLQVWRAVGNGVPVLIATLPGTAATFVDNAANAALYKYTPAVSALMTYTYQIKAVNSLAPVAAGAAVSTSLTVTTPMIPVTAPTILSATPNATGTSVVLRWTDNANNETAYWVDVTVGGATTRTVIPRSAAQGTAINGALSFTIATTPGSIYTLAVTAVNVGAVTSTSTPATIGVDLSAPLAPAAPLVTLGAQTATRAPLSWPAVVGATSYVVQVATNGGNFVSLPQTANPAANPAIAAGNSYQFQVLAQTTKYGLTTQSVTASNVIVVNTPPAISTTPVAVAGLVGSKQITLSWTNVSSNITGFTVQRRFAGVWTTLVPTPAWTQSGTGFSLTDTVPAVGSYSYRLSATSAGGTTANTGTSNTVAAP
jgi:hypothetical protein